MQLESRLSNSCVFEVPHSHLESADAQSLSGNKRCLNFDYGNDIFWQFQELYKSYNEVCFARIVDVQVSEVYTRSQCLGVVEISSSK